MKFAETWNNDPIAGPVKICTNALDSAPGDGFSAMTISGHNDHKNGHRTSDLYWALQSQPHVGQSEKLKQQRTVTTGLERAGLHADATFANAMSKTTNAAMTCARSVNTVAIRIAVAKLQFCPEQHVNANLWNKTAINHMNVRLPHLNGWKATK